LLLLALTVSARACGERSLTPCKERPEAGDTSAGKDQASQLVGSGRGT
jgi:hypothetical protein